MECRECQHYQKGQCSTVRNLRYWVTDNFDDRDDYEDDLTPSCYRGKDFLRDNMKTLHKHCKEFKQGKEIDD